jgi:hypothetical protein
MSAAMGKILSLANERGKFAIEVGYLMEPQDHAALEELLLTGRVRLIDVSPVKNMPGIFRVFQVVP